MTAYNAKDYENAFKLTQQALASAEKEYGTESPRYALSAHNLGYMHMLRKEYTDAAKYYLKAIAIRSTLKLEADYAMSAGQYGNMLRLNLNDPVNAEKYLLIAKELNKKLYTEKSKQYYATASDLGKLYFDGGQYTKAEPYYAYMLQATREQSGIKSENYALMLKDIMLLYEKFPDKSRYFTYYEELLTTVAALGYDNNENYYGGMFTLGSYYEEQKNLPKAIRTYQTMLSAVKKNLGDTSAMYLAPLLKITRIYNQLGDYKNMSVVSEEMVDILSRKPGDRDAYLTGLEGAASVFQLTADYTKAESALIRLTEALKKDAGGASTGYLAKMIQLGDVQLNLGKHKEAERTYRDALNGRKQKDILYAANLSKIGYVTGITGRLNDAQKNYEEARQIFIAAKGEETNDYAVLLNYLGSLYAGMDRAEEGEALLIKALDIYKKTVGEQHQNYAVALANLASLYMNKGDFNKAEQFFIKSLNIKEAVFGKNHPEYAFGLVRIALFYKGIGNTAKWESNLLEALKIQEDILPADHPSLMTTLNNLAVFYNNTQQLARAEPYYLRSLEISKKSLGERLDYLNTLTNLAGLYVNLKLFYKATDFYNKAGILAKKLYGEELEYANVMQGMALMYDYMGEYQKAEPYFLKAYGIKQIRVPAANQQHVQLNMNMGRLYQAMKAYDKAAPYYAKARTLMLDNIDRNFAFLSEEEKQDFLNTLNYRFELLQNFYLGYQKTRILAANNAFDTELATKGLTLNAAIEMRKAIENSKNLEALKIYDEWMKIRGEISKRSINEQDTSIALLESGAAALEKQLTRISGAFNEGRTLSKASMEEVKQKLGDNDVAIEFASFRKFDDVNWKDSVIYVALVLRKGDANAAMVRLGEERQLEQLIKKNGQGDDSFIANLYESTRGVGVENVNNSLGGGKKLYELVWKPIDGLLKPGDHIYFAPSGLLHQIAFAAIPYADGKLLSDRYQLHQVSSTAVLLKPAAIAIPKSITLFGGINYDKKAATNGVANRSTALAEDVQRGSTWTYLPGTLTEAERIAKLAAPAGYATRLFTGENGLEERIKEVNTANAPGIIHIASHGFFFPDPQLSYTNTAADDNIFSKSANAMNRSGMLFAGANQAWKGVQSGTGEDGILTAYEAANLSLANTSLVVLSACETGLGDIKGNEGVFGLQRSFKMAGADYLMMSLWKVPDAETSEFMSQFYTSLFGGKPVEDAFINTQNFMKSKYPKHPYKWAAFVLVR